MTAQVWQDEEARFCAASQTANRLCFSGQPTLSSSLGQRQSRLCGKEANPGRADPTRDQIVTMLDLLPLMHRRVKELSGEDPSAWPLAGRWYRARLLLMDEPLSSLDIRRKMEILPYIERVREEIDIPVLYVTHSLDELSRLADHVLLIRNGSVAAEEVFRR